jgi:hypothetical protein
MAKNESLHKAKHTKFDEFYTQYDDIQQEIDAYLEYNPNLFKDKTILLPCDDPEFSNFTRFFAANFEQYGLKKLISTSYAQDSKTFNEPYQLSLLEVNDYKYDKSKSSSHGKIFTLTKTNNNSGNIDIDDLKWKYLNGDGDFRSDEVKKLRDVADIIITNPPFSIARTEFFPWLMETNKLFVIVGSMNWITYRDIFPYLKENKFWFGKGFTAGNAYFNIPQNGREYANGVYDEKTHTVKFRNCTWFTNIEHGRRHLPNNYMSMSDNVRFSKHKKDPKWANAYVKYDNFDAIEVPFSDSIPADYKGIMGVPISWVNHHCPEQFEIVGCADANILPVGWKGASQEFVDLYYAQGNTGQYQAGNRLACLVNANGEAKIPYKRILIRYTEAWIKNHPNDFLESEEKS